MRKSIYRIKIHINLTSIFIFLLRWNIKFVLLFMALLERVRLSKYCGDLFEWCIGWHHLQLLHISTSRVFIFIFICSYILSLYICLYTYVCVSHVSIHLSKKKTHAKGEILEKTHFVNLQGGRQTYWTDWYWRRKEVRKNKWLYLLNSVKEKAQQLLFIIANCKVTFYFLLNL